MNAEPTARLMVVALRRFEEQLLQRLHADGFTDVTVAQTNLLRHLDNEGMRLTDLADDAGVSKQAVSQAVRGLVARDLVVVVPDPDDGRARRVEYTARGLDLIAHAVRHVVALERAWEQQLGADTYRALREGLTAMTNPRDE
jgi:DNA-binding MarR family transcriptional regulator